jgi:lactoylglutathione lyase
MRVTKLLHTRMRVSNLDETIRFYTTVLGLDVLERKTSPRGSQLAFLKVPNSDELIELTSFPPSGPVHHHLVRQPLHLHRRPGRL